MPRASRSPRRSVALIDPVYTTSTPLPNDYVPAFAPPAATPDYPTASLGFVLFDEGVVKDKFGDTYRGDPAYRLPTATTYATDGEESGEESWFDDNATAVLINRYNGTLVKGD